MGERFAESFPTYPGDRAKYRMWCGERSDESGFCLAAAFKAVLEWDDITMIASGWL